MNNVNKILFTKERFGDELYIKVSQQIKILIEAGNICTVFSPDDNSDVVIIEHVSANSLSLQPYPYYLFPDEANYVSIYIAKKNLKQYESEALDLANSIKETEDEVDDELSESKDSKSDGCILK